jgi:GPH family glycoside/pentoside/hexuronide:cation symporter
MRQRGQPLERGKSLNKLQKLFGYGIGDFGLNIYWKTISLYLVYWYTTIVGLDPRIAGTLFFIGMTWDAISDPIIASLSERVTSRFGTYRPFLLYGSVALGFAFVLQFWVPPFTGPRLILYLIIACVIFRSAYTIVAIPYAAMASRLTYDSIERADYSGARMFCAFLGLLLISMFLPPLVEVFTTRTGSEQKAFQYAAAIGAIVASLAILLCFAMTKEQPLPPQTVRSKKVWSGITENIRTNRSLRILICLIILNTVAGASLSLTLVFFIDANQAKFASKEAVLTAYAIGTLIFVPIWTFCVHRYGRKKIWTIIVLIYIAVALHMLVFSSVTISGIPIQIIIFGACGGGLAMILWAFIPDCVEFGQIDSGYRSEAGVFGSVMVTQKLSGALTGLLVGFMLAAFGVSQASDGFIVSSEKMTLFLAIVPALLLALSLIPVFQLPLERAAHSDIIDKLQNKDVTHG